MNASNMTSQVKVEIQHKNHWIEIPVLDSSRFPTLKIVWDSCEPWFHLLLERNGKVSSFRIDGIVGSYVVSFEDKVYLEPKSIMFCWLSIAKAVPIPDGSVVTLGDGKTFRTTKFAIYQKQSLTEGD